MKKILIAFAIIALSLTSCNLDEQPQATADKEIIFGSEAGLEAYAYSFYAVFPSAGNSSNPSTMDAMCDYGCVNGINKFIRDGGYNSSTETNWSWGRLRNINYFIDNCINPKVSQTIRDNYIGIARFFRAYFYYDKLTTYGEVPWIDHTLTVDAEELYASRDSRDVIINHIIEDLDFAYTHITTTKNDGSMITKWVPAAFKSRVCLFEGTYRKYHTELNLASSANALLEKAVLAAKEVMEKSGHGINTAGTTPYRDLFKSDNPITKEVMLAVCCSKDLSVLGAQNWWWNSSTFGIRFSPIKAYVNT
ncbi:MAG: RagB/SusD family nutrient uptake outer membrane protein, partial [Alistipes sp.]